MAIPLCDPRLPLVPVRETYEPLVLLGASFGRDRARVRSSVAARLRHAQAALPPGVSLRVLEGYHTDADSHRSGAAVDVTLVDLRGIELDLDHVPRWRALLAGVLAEVGLVNDPEQWWHWSFGDRHWAAVTGAEAAHFGPVADLDAAAAHLGHRDDVGSPRRWPFGRVLPHRRAS